MSNHDLKALQDILQGHYYLESVLLRALEYSTGPKVTKALRDYITGIRSFDDRMLLQHFVCDLTLANKG